MPQLHGGPIGRPRDEDLDRQIVEAAATLLAEEGVDHVTFARVADRAGTTRPALYRRYASPSDLVLAALRRIADAGRPSPTGDHLADLEAELRSFRDAIRRANSLSLVGSMLVAPADPEAVEAYRELIVRPRRARLRAILSSARTAGAITATPIDIEIATTMCTGSYYAAALAGRTPPRDWPRRTARLVWRACGGAI